MADPAPEKPPTVVELIWEHDLVLSGKSGDARLTLDSHGQEGPSPVQALAFALAGCMAMDVVHILTKGRHDLRGLRVDLEGQPEPEQPRRFNRIAMRYTLTGNIPHDAIERAVQLSREKYCSVWHSMRQDIDLQITFTVSEGV